MLYLCICIHRIPIHISIFVPDLLADGLNPNAHNTIGSLEPPLGPRAAILRRRSRGGRLDVKLESLNLLMGGEWGPANHGRGWRRLGIWRLFSTGGGGGGHRRGSGWRLVTTMPAGVILPLGGVILLTSHSMWSRVKTWSGSPGRMTAGLGLCNLLGDVIF
jgi:hypothetical protein